MEHQAVPDVLPCKLNRSQPARLAQQGGQRAAHSLRMSGADPGVQVTVPPPLLDERILPSGVVLRRQAGKKGGQKAHWGC